MLDRRSAVFGTEERIQFCSGRSGRPSGHELLRDRSADQAELHGSDEFLHLRRRGHSFGYFGHPCRIGTGLSGVTGIGRNRRKQHERRERKRLWERKRKWKWKWKWKWEQ